MSLTPGEVALGGSQDLPAVCVEGVARLGLAVFERGHLWHGPSFGFVFERALSSESGKNKRVRRALGGTRRETAELASLTSVTGGRSPHFWGEVHRP
jgi:hypothetical protein